MPHTVALSAAEAERYLGIPASKVRTWAARGRLHPLRRPVDLDSDRLLDYGGPVVYDVGDLLFLRDMNGRHVKRRRVRVDAASA